MSELKVLKHDIYISYLGDGRATAALIFDGGKTNHNYNAISAGENHLDAALKAVTKAFELAEKLAPHLLTEGDFS